MGIIFVSWSIFLCLLLVMCYNGNNKVNAIRHPMNDGIPTGMNVLQLHSMDVDDKYHSDVKRGHAMDDHLQIHGEKNSGDAHIAHVHAHPSSHMDHMDASLMVFFFIEDLKVGKTIPIYFPKRDPSSSPHFLPREESNSIPFSLESLPHLLQIFSFPQDSPQAKAMEDTLRECELKPIKGESKLCATSLESMLDFVNEIFGFHSQIKVLSTTHFTKSTARLQNYTILKKPVETPAPKMVACHTMPYPYAIFYCHYQESESKVFKVLLEGENGERADAVAVCHLDTSQWSPSHVSFGVLGIEPGSKPVCHFFPADNLVWIALPSFLS